MTDTTTTICCIVRAAATTSMAISIMPATGINVSATDKGLLITNLGLFNTRVIGRTTTNTIMGLCMLWMALLFTRANG